MERQTLEQAVESLRSALTPALVEAQVRELLRQKEDVGGGVNAIRLVRHLLGGLAQNNAQASTDEFTVWAYSRLKSALSAVLAEIPSLYFFEGD